MPECPSVKKILKGGSDLHTLKCNHLTSLGLKSLKPDYEINGTYWNQYLLDNLTFTFHNTPGATEVILPHVEISGSGTASSSSSSSSLFFCGILVSPLLCKCRLDVSRSGQ